MKQGFTLIEILVAIALFSVVLLAITGLLLSQINAVYKIQNRFVAVNLAQGEVEAIIAKRNQNWKSGSATNFMNGIDSVGIGTPESYMRDTSGFYTTSCSGCENTRFSREITVEKTHTKSCGVDGNKVAIPSADCAFIKIVIYWSDVGSVATPSTSNNVTVRFRLYNWGASAPSP